MKISIIGQEARNKAFNGLEYVARGVISSIGPYGLNALLEKGRKITNDGATISAELVGTLVNEFERLAAEVAHEASAKTNDMVGDATSTAWALNYSIIKEAKRYLPSEKSIKAKKTQAELAQMINKSKDFVLSELEKMTTPITSKEELIKSALVSSEDEKLSNLLGSMQWELGENGHIIAEEVNDSHCSIEKAEGLVLDNGFTTSGLVTNQEDQSLELINIPIFLTNYTIGDTELIKLKESLFTPLINHKKYGIVLMARAFTPDAIKICQESTKTGFSIFPLNAPYTDQKEVMKDIEAVVGGRYIDVEESSLEDVMPSDAGFARKIIAKQFNAMIAGNEDEKSKERITKRVENLTKRLSNEPSDFMKRMIEERIAQLTGGFAILKVGSRSVTERKRLKDKADDAVNAVRLALKGGTVKGGGLAFKEISDKMEDEDILKRPLTVVYDQIMSSAPEGFVIADWVRDPYLVLKTALENAAEFDIPFLSINIIATTKDKKEKDNE